MNKEKQRIAIAKACGWEITLVNVMDGWKPVIKGKQPNSLCEIYIPDFLNDLNAMHEAEQRFIGDASQAMTFAMHLLRVRGQNILTEHHDLNCDHAWIAVSATAAQRAEAFLRTLNLWEESE
jgi:hypothetical protein